MTIKIRFPYTGNDQFILNDIEHSKLYDDETLYAQRLLNNSFILKTKGNGTITIDGVALRTSEDEPLIIHVPKRSNLTISSNESLEYYKLSYQVRPNPARIAEPSIFILEPGNILPIYEKAEQLFESFHSKEPIAFQSVALFYNFLTYIWKELLAKEEMKPMLDVADQVIEWIDHRYREQITLEDLSKVFQYSIKHLSRLVKKRIGMSPIQYLIHVRMEKAKAMLLNTDAKLNEIAKRTGYNDLFYFSNHFKKNIGISPTEYRKRSMQSQEAINRKSRKSMSKATEPSYNLIDSDYQLRRDLLFMIKRFGFKPYLIGLFCFVLVLQACGNEDAGGTAPEESSGEEVESTDENSDFPRTVEDAAGNEVVLEEPPERIAITFWSTADYLISLGIMPIATTGLEKLHDAQSLDPYEDEVAQIEDIGDPGVLDMEMLAEMSPDLILGRVSDADYVDQLSQIAPTYQTDFSSDSWDGALRTLAELTGKEEEAEDLITGLEAEIVETRGSLDYNSEDTVVIVRLYGGMENMWLVGDELYEYLFHEEKGLGLNTPEDYSAEGDEISLEALIDLNPDYLLAVEEDEDAYEAWLEQLNDSDAWQTTNAAKNEDIHYVNSLSFGPLEIQNVLNRMKEIFGEK